MRFVRVALTGALLLATASPSALRAQSATGPRCKDGTRSPRTGFTACWFHGGLADAPAARPAARPAPADPSPNASPRAAGAASRRERSERSERSEKKACDKHQGVAGWINPDIPPE